MTKKRSQAEKEEEDDEGNEEGMEGIVKKGFSF